MFLKKRKIKGNKIIDFNTRSKKIEMNIGILIFSVIFLYLLGVCYNYFTAHNISTYEVRYGSIINDTAYTGLALREEKIYQSTEPGYIQFYYLDGSRISHNNSIYTISPNNNDVVEPSSIISESGDTLDLSTLQSVLNEIQSFNTTYSNDNYSSTYDMNSRLHSILNNRENTIKISVLESLDTNTANFNLYRADCAGIISYNIDGYEDVTLNNFSPEMLNTDSYVSSSISTGDKIAQNVPIYKLITDESWEIIFKIHEEDLAVFEEQSKVELKFVADGQSTVEDFSIIESEGAHYGVVSMNKNMIRYLNYRFMDIELIFNELEGYKIPKSSVITREFYKIPLDYISRGGDSSANGLVLQNEDGSIEFAEANVYYQDEEYGYILSSVVPLNQTIVMEKTSEKLKVNDVVELDGVYNINKGYAEFKCVRVLTESSEYFIVDDSMSYSISNYDRIALYGDSVEEYVVIN